MAYTTVAKVRRRARAITVAVRTDADVTAEIAESDAIIDAMLENAYGDNVPFATTPTLIDLISRNLTAGTLLGEVYGEDNPEETTYGERLVNQAMEFLVKLASGEIRLTISGHTFADRIQSTTYNTDTDVATEEVFTRGDPLTWKDPMDFDPRDADVEDRA